MKKIVRQFSLGIVIIIAVLINTSTSQKNEDSNRMLLLKNVAAIAWADSESEPHFYCSSNCYYLPGDVCRDCWCCCWEWDFNENGSVGLCM